MEVRRKGLLESILVYGVLLILSITCVYPFLYFAMNSFKTMAGYYTNPNGLPTAWTMDSIRTMFAVTDIFRGFANSVIVTVGAVALIIVVSLLAGFSFAKLRFPGRSAAFVGVISFQMVPVQVIVVPLYVQMAGLRLVNSYWLIILIYSAVFAPFGVYLMRAYFSKISDELIEAGMIDGLTYNQVFWRLMIATARPAIASLAVLEFVNIWTEFLISLIFLQDPLKRTVTVGVALLTSHRLTNYPVLFAALLFSSLPTIVFFLLFQKHLVRGVTAGISK